MLGKLRVKFNEESGAVTVDWVVLTAAVVAINIGVIITSFQSAMEEAGTEISTQAANAIN